MDYRTYDQAIRELEGKNGALEKRVAELELLLLETNENLTRTINILHLLADRVTQTGKE
jgi:uncharacterized coiled-coil protein SlyX